MLFQTIVFKVKIKIFGFSKSDLVPIKVNINSTLCTSALFGTEAIGIKVPGFLYVAAGECQMKCEFFHIVDEF